MTFDEALAQKVRANDIIQLCMMWDTSGSSIEDRIQNERVLQHAWRSKAQAEGFLSVSVFGADPDPVTRRLASAPEGPSAS